MRLKKPLVYQHCGTRKSILFAIRTTCPAPFKSPPPHPKDPTKIEMLSPLSDDLLAQMVPSTSATPPSPEQSARKVACLRCRNRRSFCSKEKPKCLRCREGRFECRYEEARRVAVKESYLRGLQAKVKAYEDLVGKRTPKLDDSEEEFDDEQDLLVPFTNLGIETPSTKYKGPGAADMFVRHVNREFSQVPGDDDGLDINPNIYDPSALPSRRTLFRTQVRLPPPEVARRLFSAQYTYIGTIFAFADPASFDGELVAAYRGQPDPSDKDACLAYAKVLVILAFGKMYSVNQWIDYQGPPGFEYFSQALQLLPDAHEEGSILCVETLALIGYFMQNMNRPDAAFLYTGMALRMAISLGLHQEVNADSRLDPAAREHRRRVWWSVYSLDRILSVKSGNPITIHDEDIGVNLPAPLPSESPYCPAVVIRHYTVLSRILGDITQAIYRRTNTTPKSARRLMASVQSIILSLSKWDRELPDQLRFDPAKLATTRESVSTFSHYYQCINMTARPLLIHVVRKRLLAIRTDPSAKEKPWHTGLSQTTVRVIKMCVSAAEETIHMMTEARAHDLLATYGYMDGEHVFSAAIVLVMVCAAFPDSDTSTQAMNAGLELLREMAERGWNSHMGARYELLAHMRSVFLPDVATPEEFGVGIPGWSSRDVGTVGLVAAQAAVTPNNGASEEQGVDVAVGILGGNEVSEGLLQVEDMVSPFTVVDTGPMFEGGGFGDETMGGGVDLMLWEEGFANAAVDAGDFSQWNWTQGV